MLNENCLKQIYFADIHTYLNYANITWAGTHKTKWAGTHKTKCKKSKVKKKVLYV